VSSLSTRFTRSRHRVRHPDASRRAAYILAAASLVTLAACQDSPAAPERAHPSAGFGGPIQQVVPQNILFARKVAGDAWQLFTIKFDGSALTQVTTGLASHLDPARSRDYSRIAYVERDSYGTTRLWVKDVIFASGPVSVTPLMNSISHPAFSPDGQTLAFSAKVTENGTTINQVFTVPVQGGTPKRITSDANNDVRPTWNQYGDIVYVGGPATQRDVYMIKADGSMTYPIAGSGTQSDVAVSRDCNRMAMVSNQGRMIEVATTSPLSMKLVLEAAQGETFSNPSFSPDGQQIAYISTTAAGSELKVVLSDGAAHYTVTDDWNMEANPAWGR
jgi:Tol biopolymer transport system component